MRNEILSNLNERLISDKGGIKFFIHEPNENLIPKTYDNSIFSNLSNRRITDIYYYHGEFEFKKRLKDKNHLKSNELLNFIPVRGVFQYKMIQSRIPLRSKFFNNLNINENISFICDRYKGFYHDNREILFKCVDLLFMNMNLKKINCVYIVYGLINNKKVRLILPISVYMELEKKYSLLNLINNHITISIKGNVLYGENCLTSYESNIIDNNVNYIFNHKINIHNELIDGRINYLKN